MKKDCRGPCGRTLPLDEFYKCATGTYGRHSYCKVCLSTYCRKWRVQRSESGTASHESSSTDEPMTGPPAPVLQEPDSLYVATYSFDDAIVKIGRSANVHQRLRDLESSHNFHVLLLAEFPGLGHLEPKLHEHFKDYRSDEGRGREWFRVSLAQVASVLGVLLALP